MKKKITNKSRRLYVGYLEKYKVFLKAVKQLNKFRTKEIKKLEVEMNEAYKIFMAEREKELKKELDEGVIKSNE